MFEALSSGEYSGKIRTDRLAVVPAVAGLPVPQKHPHQRHRMEGAAIAFVAFAETSATVTHKQSPLVAH